MIYPWLDIAFSLTNPFDFQTFTEKMELNGLEHAFQDFDYFQRIGMIQGRIARDSVGHQEAYSGIIAEMSASYGLSGEEKAKRKEHRAQSSNCGGCGGSANKW